MYTQHFGLSGKPFRLSPDASFFFPSKEHNRALAFLDYGIEQADGFIVITGDVGTGKTTILQTLLERLDAKKIRVATVVTTQLGHDDMLELLAGNLGIKEQSGRKALLLQGIEELLINDYKAGRRVVLILDEAQNLSPRAVEELRMLSNFQMDGQPLLQIFLVGQSELRATLLSPGFEQLRQRVIATYHLNPLDENETCNYIEHRLHRVGWEEDPDITDGAFSAIFDATDGVPRRVNNLCDRLFLYAFLEDLHVIDEEVVQVVAEEIGSEFATGLPDEQNPRMQARGGFGGGDGSGGGMSGGAGGFGDRDERDDDRVFDRPGEQLESMARVMFDKANIQQRLGALERAVDGLGLALKPEVAEIREELAYVRGLLEDVLIEMRGEDSDPSHKRHA